MVCICCAADARAARAFPVLRHSAAHVMADAVQKLFPGTKVTIGPAIEDGFYYDFAREEPFTPEDLPKIEEEMRKIIKAGLPPAARSGRATRRPSISRASASITRPS